MVSPSQIAMQLVDWTDPRRLVDLSKTNTDFETIEEETTMRNRNIHVDLAILIMQQMKKGSSTNPHLTNYG
jgi:Nuclear condensing complex subunits, C-term domain